jgi:acetylglutamate kinase
MGPAGAREPVVTATASTTGAVATSRPAGDAPVVIKLGGRSLDAPGAPEQLADALAALPGARVLVHGGGAEVSAWLTRAGIEPRFADGLRVTDAPTLEIATAVLAGLANKRLVARLRAAGLPACGLSALDGGLLACEPHADAARLGAVGAVTGADVTALRALLAAGLLPVVASIGQCDGALLNLNADDAACALASALGARELVLLSDTPGVKLGGAPVATLGPAALDAALAGDEITGGMRPKLRAARAALQAGVGRVHVAAWDGPGALARLFDGAGAGTTLIREDA